MSETSASATTPPDDEVSTESPGPHRPVGPDAGGRRLSRDDLVALGAWIAAVIVALAVLERRLAPRTFFYDEWAFVFDRRAWDAGSLLDAHNGHLSILPAAAYKVLFELVGIDHYRPYRLLGLLVHAGVASAVVVYVRARLGTVAALCSGVLVLFLGSGWQNVFWPFQIGYMGSVGAAVMAWRWLDAASVRRDRLASAAHLVALACSGLGIAALVGTVARLCATGDWRRAVRVAAVPSVVYGSWYVAFGVSEGSTDNLPHLARYVVDSAAWSVGGLGGRDLLWGRLLAGVLVGGAVALAAVGHRVGPAVVAPAACAVANWLLTGYSRAQLNDPGASRYVYVGGVFVILVIADVLSRVGAARLRAALAVAAVMGVWGNWAVLQAGSAGLRETTAVTRSELRALEWAGAAVDADYRPDTVRMPQVAAGPYLAAVADLGSPAASDAEVSVAAATTRAEVDRVSLEIGGLARTPDGPPALERTASSCRTDQEVGDTDSGGTVELDLEGGSTFEVSGGAATVEVRIRRYATSPPVEPTATVGPFDDGSHTLVADGAPVTRWRVELASVAAFEYCTVPATDSVG